MENEQITVWLSPLNGGSSTRFRLVGSTPTALPVWEMRQLLDRIRFFSGSRLRFVLSAGLEEANWSEWWTALLAGIPGRLLEVECRTIPPKRSGWKR